MKEKSNENHLPKVVGIHEHLLKKESGVKVIPLDSSNGKWDFQSARILLKDEYINPTQGSF